jgi:hypothetical protein
MKRINLSTNAEFKFGDIREDGRLFWGYKLSKPVKRNGFFMEDWLVKEAFEKKYLKNLKFKKQDFKNNPKKYRVKNKKWFVENIDKHNALSKKRKAAKLQRTPVWLTDKHFEQIEEFYTVCKMFQMYTGEQYHVDHIVPLQGKNVSGLHTPWNLQILPAKQNLSKGNNHGVF